MFLTETEGDQCSVTSRSRKRLAERILKTILLDFIVNHWLYLGRVCVCGGGGGVQLVTINNN